VICFAIEIGEAGEVRSARRRIVRPDSRDYASRR